MAKSYSVTVSHNDSTPAAHTVLVKDTEQNLLHPAFVYRVWDTLDLNAGDTLSITAISGPSNASDPMGGWAIIPWFQVVVDSGQITLAFID
jgi:hypothetical protein